MIVLFKTNLEKNNKYKILRNFSDKNRKTLYKIYISKQRFRSKKYTKELNQDYNLIWGNWVKEEVKKLKINSQKMRLRK